ncbi:histidine kinase [Nocardioides sp. GCM10028917]|uniref:GAF domain-containing sensor histidine kinase n=1 Tax=Nocardioides sp. GCM10028917 TaxID=3273408 RepID=UPI00361E81D6
MSRATVVGHEGSRSVVLAGWGAAAASVLVIYLAVVLGGGALMGRTESPSLPLSILATALVAGVAPLVRARAEQARAQKLGDTTSPYDVLADFSRVADSDAGDRAPALIARMLVQGLALEWAQVWVLVGEELRLLATHPPEAVVDEAAPRLYDDRRRGGVHAVTVAHAGRPLGVVRVMGRQDRPLAPTAERLLGGLAAQAGMVLESAQLREELALRVQELTVRERELRRARVALVTAQDTERRRLERDIHDGAQQQLVALTINLKLAAVHVRTDPELAREVLQEQLAATGSAIQTLTDLARGMLPATLAQEGLAAALSEATAANPVPVLVRGGDVPRLPGGVEATLYFCALEAVQNATKHADSTRIDLLLESGPAGVSVAVEDNGSGIAPGAHQGSGLANLSERAASVGGRLVLGGRPGGGTRIAVHVPRPRLSESGGPA